MPRIRAVLALAAALALAACYNMPQDSPPGTPDYRQGYANGCDSGLSDADNPYYHVIKDPALYGGNADYRRGWDEGHQKCFDQYTHL